MSDDVDLKPDGTPTLAQIVLLAGEGAYSDGAISFDDLQVMRELSSVLKEFKVGDVGTLRNLLGIR
jgi:hypothetical protein